MRNKHLILLILFFCLFSAALGWNYYRTVFAPHTQDDVKDCLTVLPDASRCTFVPAGEAPAHYKGFKSGAFGRQSPAGIAFLTTDVTPDIRGYAGPVKLMVGLDPQGTITGVRMISHSETFQYVGKIDSFLKQFVRRRYRDHFEIGKDIDGISRATITSRAIARSVAEGSRIMAAAVLDFSEKDSSAKGPPFPWLQIIIPLILFGLATAGIVLRNRAFRRAALFGGLIYLGFAKSTMVSIIQVTNVGLLKIPAFADNPLWYALLIPAFVFPLVLGMVYCGSICPFAGVQEGLYYAGQRLFRKKHLSLPPLTDNKARTAKYVLLFTVLGLSFVFGNAGPAAVEPFLTFFTRHATPLGWTFLGLILVLSLFCFRFWCRYLCPVGALMGLFSRFSLFKIRLGSDCGGCELCRRTCPMQAITCDAHGRPAINYPECILCNKCVQKCPRGSLHLETGFKRTPAEEKP